ncbi:V-set and immunoglobulin domain-containing protein 10 [Odontesthes bonariensis]|uniref:V-set and immunoglobulin domain-containing protein 10 n=1 Tax=Odontesthes bonariensis TaxID=219752 RepID=UPI003F58CF61
MNKVATVALLHLLLSASGSGDGSTETALTAAPGDVALLPCYTVGNVTPTLTTWMKNGREVNMSDGVSVSSPSPAGRRLSVLHDGSLNIMGVIPGDEGSYMCASTLPDNSSFQAHVLLQVTNVPDTHPDCMYVPAQDPSQVQFNCSWFGAYPPPKLRWGEDGAFQVTNTLSVTMNSSLLSDGQTMRCTAQHQLLGPGTEKSCSLTLKIPYPVGEPLATALEATSVTLTCSETTSFPPANTVWRKGLQHDSIVSGSKYVLSQEGLVFKLTILNVSQDDQGVYFCHSENQLAIRELEVYLTVKKASSAYTGAIIGVFIAALIVGSAVIVAKTLYSSRHRICLGGDFGQIEEDRGDMLSLVESDDEQLFQDAVPRLPPVTNGRHTTLVQIHRMPSSDHEDAETADTSPQQLEDTEQAEEPEDLVTF